MGLLRAEDSALPVTQHPWWRRLKAFDVDTVAATH